MSDALRVRVLAPWSTFRGREGEVIWTDGKDCLVLLDGEAKAMKFAWEVLSLCP